MQPMRIGIPKEITDNEHRVAMVPSLVSNLTNLGATVLLEKDAGKHAGYPDALYDQVEFCSSAETVYQNADIVLKVEAPTTQEIAHFKKQAILIGLLSPGQNQDLIKALNEKQITSFALERLPRISRAQSMDVLSSQATIAGYKAVLIAANNLNRFFPMLTTAAGTIRPAHVLIIGAGVAGLQAIATAKRLGAIVSAYDIRPQAREQIESLGARMVNIDLKAEGTGGYARELTDEEKEKQHNALKEAVAKSEAVITTAMIPNKAAPVIITKKMVELMAPGSVIVDIAALSGGNCALTKANKTVHHHGVTILGPTNLASTLSKDASDMYAKNLFNFMNLFIKEGKISIDWKDEVLSQSALTHEGKILGGTES
jgi:NAD(P) transhydrogenase subunit alpha